MFILEIGPASSSFSRSLLEISDDETSIEVCQEGGSAQDLFGKIMAPCTLDIKFPYGTRFIFRSMTFAAGEDRNLKMLSSGSAPERIAPVYG
jgi:hypothetical protein